VKGIFSTYGAMKKNSRQDNTKKIGLIKILGWCAAAGIMLVLIFLFTSFQVGPVKKMRAVSLLEYTGVIKDKRNDAEIIRSLKSDDEVEQFHAITAMAYRRYSPANAEALLIYLKSNTGTKRVRDIAVWALGELHAPEAEAFLDLLLGSEDLDQYEIRKALKKIRGEISKPFWRR